MNRSKEGNAHFPLYPATSRSVAVCSCGAAWPHVTDELTAIAASRQVGEALLASYARSAALSWDGPEWAGETIIEVLHWGAQDQPLRSWVSVENSDGRPALFLHEGPALGSEEWGALEEDVRADWDGCRTSHRRSLR